MTSTRCRVQILAPEAAAETDGTIAIERSAGGEAFVVTTARPKVAVAARLSRDEAIAFLLAGAEALGMVLLGPREAARRRAAGMKRKR